MTESEATPEETPTPKSAGLVDLSDLRMMPAWVTGMSAPSQFTKYEEREDRGPRRDGGRRDGDRRGGPPPRRDGPGGFGGGQNRDRGDFRPRRDGPPGQGGGPRRDRDDRGGPRRFGDRDRGFGQDRPQREWVEMPKDIKVIIEPEDKSAETLAHHIRTSGHAFSMFDAARLVLAEGERFHARFVCAPERATGLFVTTADGGLFISRDEALNHVLRSPAIESYYKVEELELEEPKGDFKSIGVCGFTGELLGPPSHHSFQTALIRLHRERFANMSLEDYKRRVRTEVNPDVVAQWKEKQRKGQRWVYVKDQEEGAEPVTFNTRAEMEAHFRRVHGEDAAVEGREVVIPGNQEKNKLTHILGIMMRNAVEGARKHLFEMSQKLGGTFERRGLKLFKRRAGKLFVSRVKPRAIDPGVVFSERVSKIVEVLKTVPGMPLAKLVEAIVPGVEAAPAPAPAEGEAAAAPAQAQLTDDQISVVKDLRWLTNEGYVIEYSDGMVFLGVQGEPSTPKDKEGKEPGKGKGKAKEALAAAGAEGEGEGAAEAATATDETPSEVASEDAPVSEEVSDIKSLEGVSLEAQAELNESSPGPSSDSLEPEATSEEAPVDAVSGDEGPEAAEAEAELNKTAAPVIEPEEETLEEEPVAPELPTTIIEPKDDEKKAE